MRTTDFSLAPVQARAGAIVLAERVSNADGESAHAVVERVHRARGHLWHHRFHRRGQWGDEGAEGRVSGVIVCFVDQRTGEAFAGSLSGSAWQTRVLSAEPSGYSNGVWRAEGNVMAHIERYTPTSHEAARGADGPPVAGPVRDVDSPASKHPDRSRRRRPGRVAAGGGRPLTDAGAMFIGATKYRGLRSWLVLSRTWYPMIARLRGLRGYVWHTVYWEAPFTLGTLAFFATRDDLLSFARLPAHRHLMQWITRDTRNGTGGYIRLLVASDTPHDEGGDPG